MGSGAGTGRVEVIAGPMFAGKSEELMRRVRRARIAGRAVEVVDHALDTRRGAGAISSHSGLGLPARGATTAVEVEALAAAAVEGAGLDLLAIDEAQFFGPDLVDVVQRIADRGVLVVVAGLDVTFDGRPFEPLPTLGALAESLTKLTAVCAVCGRDAVFHVRLDPRAVDSPNPDPSNLDPSNLDPSNLDPSKPDPLTASAAHIGGAESYQARCRRHFDPAPWRHSTSGTKL